MSDADKPTDASEIFNPIHSPSWSADRRFTDIFFGRIWAVSAGVTATTRAVARVSSADRYLSDRQFLPAGTANGRCLASR
jgi:hypothetical protein